MRDSAIEWLLASEEPWTRCRTRVDLLGLPEDDPEGRTLHAEMVAHPQVHALVAGVAAWPGYALKRHNDARHPLHSLSTLADFGVKADDPGVPAIVQALVAHQSSQGAFQTLVNVPRAFGGTGEDQWTWMACDAPTLLYALLAIGLGDDPGVQRAVRHMVGLIEEVGWPCSAAPELGKFRGPGRRSDPCPIANVYALKALSQLPEQIDGSAARAGAEMLLWHWAHQRERKLYLFGIGTDFRKLKYPFVWYDILHVVDVLSRLPFVHGDLRFQEMVEAILVQAGEGGRYTAGSMYRAWKGWSFADKRQPSPWLTLLVLRILKRTGRLN
jgi:hypothetical protein